MLLHFAGFGAIQAGQSFAGSSTALAQQRKAYQLQSTSRRANQCFVPM